MCLKWTVPSALFVSYKQILVIMSKFVLDPKMLKTAKFKIFIASCNGIDFRIYDSYFFSPEVVMWLVTVKNSLVILFKMWKSRLNFLNILQMNPEKNPSKSEFF